MKKLGKWAFVIGIIIAIAAGFFAIPKLAIILFVLGLIVGLLNITGEEAVSYLIAVIALLIIGIATAEGFSFLGVAFSDKILTILGNFIAFIAPSGLVVAIKVVLSMAKTEKK